MVAPHISEPYRITQLRAGSSDPRTGLITSKGLIFNQVNQSDFTEALSKAGFYKDWRERYGRRRHGQSRKRLLESSGEAARRHAPLARDALVRLHSGRGRSTRLRQVFAQGMRPYVKLHNDLLDLVAR